MSAFAIPKYFIVRWKQPDAEGHRGIDVLSECQYNDFMKDDKSKNNIELIKINVGYEPTLRIKTAKVYKGKPSDGFCA